MDLVYDVVDSAASPAVIKVSVLAVADVNAINNMIKNTIQGVEFISANTDAQALGKSDAPKRIQLGTNLTKGLGAGANPEVGQRSCLGGERGYYRSGSRCQYVVYYNRYGWWYRYRCCSGCC